MNVARAFTLSAVAACHAFIAIPATSQTVDVCAPYQAAISSGASGSVPVVSEELLSVWRVAVSCLVPIVGALNNKVKTLPVSADVRSNFLSATGGLRAIMSKISTAEDKNNLLPENQRNPQIDKVTTFIAEFQKNSTIDVISALTYGSHSDNYDMRLNSVLILGNVIDETAICVPLIHLYDPTLDNPGYGVNGRANLLGLLSKVAPWAYFEDYYNITNARAYVLGKVTRDDPAMAGTNRLLDNIEKRLLSQTDRTNKSVHLSDKSKDACRKYMQAYPPNPTMTANVRYD